SHRGGHGFEPSIAHPTHPRAPTCGRPLFRGDRRRRGSAVELSATRWSRARGAACEGMAFHSSRSRITDDLPIVGTVRWKIGIVCRVHPTTLGVLSCLSLSPSTVPPPTMVKERR